MIHSLARICGFLIVVAGLSGDAQGQVGTGLSGMSAFGSSAFGTSGFGNAGFGASRFGSSGIGSRGFGTSGFGNAGFGASRFGSGGFGGNIGTSGIGTGGSVFGSRSFGMGGYGGAQNFIGRDSGDMAAVFNEMGRGGTQFFNQMNRSATRSSRNRQVEAPSADAAPQPMRVALEVAFAAPRPTPAAVANRIRTRFGKILADHGIDQPAVTMEGDTAVLSGVAASESQRLVIEKLVMLEPGVRQVRNEMVVIAPPAAAMPPASSPPALDR